MKIVILDQTGIKEFIPLNADESSNESFISAFKSELEKLVSSKESSKDLNLLTITDLVKIFQTTRPTIYSWIDQHLLFPIRMGGRVYFDKNDIQALIDKKRDPSTQNVKVDDFKTLF